MVDQPIFMLRKTDARKKVPSATRLCCHVGPGGARKVTGIALAAAQYIDAPSLPTEQLQQGVAILQAASRQSRESRQSRN
ncbi:MAG: hypothetical protein E5W09_10835 [Mesorhizobium sp.]|nr:MAG: hypothetical protein E5W53_12165 [Mesorhizobium sp.]TIU98744.1 MAG: hypothetical protein E5W09_10835 [Mesorhizobium sp.]